MAEAAVVVLFVLFAVLAPLVLYVLVRAEGRDRETMAREDAERFARWDPDAKGRRDGCDDRDG